MPTDRIRRAIEQITARPDPVRLAAIAALASDAADAAETGRAPLEALMDALEALTGFREDPDYWRAFHGGDGPEAFAARIAASPPDPIADLARDEIADLLALEAQLRLSDDQPLYWRTLDYLSACLGAAFDTSLIYWPHRPMDAEALVDEVVRRQAILREEGTPGLHAYERGLAEVVMAADDAAMPAQHWAQSILARG
jgi:hypothetical protein